MLSVVLGIGLLLAAPPATSEGVDRYAPCIPGLLIEYEVQRSTSTSTSMVRFVDLVRGPGQEAHTCVIDRVRRSQAGRPSKEAWVRERLDDRVSYAGTLEQPLAFRPPILKAPLEVGHHWRFDRTEYRITRAGFACQTKAGRFEACVEVRESTSEDPRESARSVYAPNVGLVAWQQGSTRMEAIRVQMQRRNGR